MHPFLSKIYHIKAKKQSFPIYISIYFVLFYFLCYNYTYHNVSNIATIFWVTVPAEVCQNLIKSMPSFTDWFTKGHQQSY